jgi:hypothetical protein
MPRRYTVVTIDGSMIADGTITTSKLADQAVTAPKIAPAALNLFKARIENMPFVDVFRTSASQISATKAQVDFSGLIFELDVSTADSKNKPNLYNSTYTSVDDGNLDTSNQESTTSTTPVDRLVKLDMGAVAEYLLFLKVGLWNGTTTYGTLLNILTSPDDVTYTNVGTISVLAGTESVVFRLQLLRDTRYIKTQLRTENSSFTANAKLYEVALWRLTRI